MVSTGLVWGTCFPLAILREGPVVTQDDSSCESDKAGVGLAQGRLLL